jgi:hypothetical protein
MTSPFACYRSLRGKSIFLLEVIPDSEMSILEIRLVEERLDEVEFEALSYVWGDQVEKKPIKCNSNWLATGFNMSTTIVLQLPAFGYHQSDEAGLEALQSNANSEGHDFAFERSKTHKHKVRRNIWLRCSKSNESLLCTAYGLRATYGATARAASHAVSRTASCTASHTAPRTASSTSSPTGSRAGHR